eukprot:758941-Hanusia_phi.AAC.6
MRALISSMTTVTRLSKHSDSLWFFNLTGHGASARSKSSRRPAMPMTPPSEDKERTRQMLPARLVVHEMLVHRLMQDPGVSAVEIGPDQQLSRGEVLSRASHFCSCLKSVGIEPGSFVATSVQSYPLSIIMHLSILMAGAVIIPCDLSQPAVLRSQLPEEAQYVLYEDDQVILGCEGFQQSETCIQKKVVEATVTGSMDKEKFINVHSFDYTTSILNVTDYTTVMETSSTENSLCWAYSTSGSTNGISRYVLIDHESVANYILNHPVLTHGGKTGEETQKKILLWSPFVFDPYAGDAFAALYHGAVLCLWEDSKDFEMMKRSELKRNFLFGCAEALQTMRATHLCTTPSILNHVALELQASTASQLEVNLPDLSVIGVGECCVYQSSHRVQTSHDRCIIGKQVKCNNPPMKHFTMKHLTVALD